MKFSISISIKDKPVPKKISKHHKSCSLLEKVKNYSKCVDSDEESAKEWYYLQRLYEKLQEVKDLTPEQEQIVYILEPLILKYNTNAKAIKGEKMLRGVDHEHEKKDYKDYDKVK